MKIILAFVLLHTVYSSPLYPQHLYEMVQSPILISKLNREDMKKCESFESKKDTTTDILLEFTRPRSYSTTRFRLPRRTRKQINKTTTTTPATTTPTLPTAPVSYSFPHTVFNPYFEKQTLILKIAKYFNLTGIPEDLVQFYIWYYNTLHDTEAADRRNRILQSRLSYSPGERIYKDIMAHTIFLIPYEHQDYYVQVNDLAADTKDPTILTFPKGMTFYKTTAMQQLIDDILYGDQGKVKSNEKKEGESIEDGPNMFYTTRPMENTTTIITTTTPEPEPFDNGPDYKDLYREDVSWLTTTRDYYEGMYEFLEKYKKQLPPDEDDRTYFF